MVVVGVVVAVVVAGAGEVGVGGAVGVVVVVAVAVGVVVVVGVKKEHMKKTKARPPDNDLSRALATARLDVTKSWHPLHSAICGSQWGSPTRYARERLGITSGTWVNWINGRFRVLESAAQQVAADFPDVSVPWTRTRMDK